MNEIAETENKRCSLSAEESMRRTIRTFAIRAGHFTACEKKIMPSFYRFLEFNTKKKFWILRKFWK